MKIKILLLVLAILIGGCGSNGNGCHTGWFPSSADIAYCQQLEMQKYEDCVNIPGHFWNGKQCIKRLPTEGCLNLSDWDLIEVINLPIGYDDIEEHYEDDKIEIRIFCTGEWLKPYNSTCEEFCNDMDCSGEISYYRIYNKEEPMELCWQGIEDEKR